MAGNRLRPLLAAEEKIIAKNMTSSTFHTPTLLEQNYDQLADQVREHGGTYGGPPGSTPRQMNPSLWYKPKNA